MQRRNYSPRPAATSRSPAARRPAPAYELAAAIRPDWSGVHVWFGDDRAVPPDDERSNYRLAKETLLDRLRVPPDVHRIRGELGAEQAADLYDAELAGVTLDLALNGIGPDGHTASLFPHAPGLDETVRRAIAAEAEREPYVPRVTMTAPVFAATKLLVYLVLGEEQGGRCPARVRRRAEPRDPGEPDPRPQDDRDPRQRRRFAAPSGIAARTRAVRNERPEPVAHSRDEAVRRAVRAPDRAVRPNEVGALVAPSFG